MNVSGRGDKDVEEALRLLGGDVEPIKARASRPKRKKKKKKSDGDGGENGADAGTDQ